MNNSSTNLLNKRDEKIIIEKRRRHQTYVTLDYLISAVSYFDFFSCDAFTIIKKAKYLSQLCQQKNINTEFLLIPLCETNTSLSDILIEHSLTSEKMANSILAYNKIKKSVFENKFTFFSNKPPSINSYTTYSYEMNIFLEKVVENALTRFKTPVITCEILLITLLEDQNSRGSKLLRNLVNNDVEWYLLRYKILKKLHNQEAKIRGEVMKNQHYFAYLLKTQLSDNEFEKLLERENLFLGVSTFRNLLISDVLKLNLFDELEKEIKFSLNKKRKYLT
jgi:hypothetical protein